MSHGCDIAVFLYEPGDGGLDRVAILLANGFAARRLNTELWMARDQGPVRSLVSDNVTVRIVSAPRLKRGIALALQVPAMRRTVRTIRPKVLLSAGNQSNLPVALACLGSQTASVAKITNPIDRPGSKGLALATRRRRFGLTARLLNLTMTLSEADARRYAGWFPKARIAAVHNPYVTEAMLAAGATRGAPNTIPQLLSVGRLAPQKDQATLLDALVLLQDRAWHLTLVGDGPLRADLTAQAKRLDIADRVTFAGFTDPLPHLATADLFVLSSRWEGLPAAPIEAMACGCPVVATDCAPGLTELLKGVTTPTPVGDAAALANAIETALTTPPDRAALNAAASPFTLAASIDDHLRLMEPFLKA